MNYMNLPREISTFLIPASNNIIFNTISSNSYVSQDMRKHL